MRAGGDAVRVTSGGCDHVRHGARIRHQGALVARCMRRLWSRVLKTSIVLGCLPDLVAFGLDRLIVDRSDLQAEQRRVRLCDMPVVLRALRPDVAIIDGGRLESVGQLRRLATAEPGTAMLVMMPCWSSREAKRLVTLGAGGCLGYAQDARDIITAIHVVSRGLRVIGSDPTNGTAPLTESALTPREAEVLELIQCGLGPKAAAAALGISPGAVRAHRRRVEEKTGSRPPAGPIRQISAGL
jgi:DNA-binding NarL/FixJ family response regulator